MYSTSQKNCANFDVFILGDFNLPHINWQTNARTTTLVRAFIDMVSDFDLNWFLNAPTHMKENCLDLIFGTVDFLPFNIPITRLRDHFPVIFEIEVLLSIKSVSNIDIISNSTFSKQMFNANLNTLYISFCNQTTSNFSSHWYSLLLAALSSSIKCKRQKHSLIPHYYFSHTMHLKNMRSSNERKPKQKWNLSFSLIQTRRSSGLSDSIELDKKI